MILIKLGGSVITNKGRPLTPRRKAIDAIAKVLSRAGEPVIIVHGGGSFGHYWSVKYDMHTEPKRYKPRGVATVKNSMAELDRIVLESLLKGGLDPYCLCPSALMSGSKPSPKGVREAGEIAKAGMTPVTYGDALWHGQKKTYILSGDRIMTHIARILKPRLCIFALNEDGLYRDIKSRELVREAGSVRASVSGTDMDVTGGMARKLKEAGSISRGGTTVFFVNGNKPRRIADAISGKRFEGTLFRRRR
ncbi:MAG: gamma-glutamyl kinase [Nitrosopumilus sp. H8]|nr:MAG: gamma-glutamyl kinase [Nitrosopumilus sp. H8]